MSDVRFYENDWLVQAVRKSTDAERAEGWPPFRPFNAYFADPPGGPAPAEMLRPSREDALAWVAAAAKA